MCDLTANTSRKKTVLLIDDDPGMLDIGRVIIRKGGYNYVCATSGEEGFKKIIEDHPDLIILDYMLPKLTGKDFFLELITNKKYEDYCKIPVIMLTARNDEGIDQDELFVKGLTAFLFKPFGHRELINIIQNALKTREIRDRNLELEEEIERTRYKYRDLIENANDLIFTLDEQGKVIFVNRQLPFLTKLKSEDWVNHFLVDLVIPQDKPVVEEAIEKCIHGIGHQFQIRIRGKDQTTKYFATNLNPLREPNSISGMVGIARDVTEKFQLESQIASLQSLTESIIKSISSGMITVDQNRRITFINSAAEEILGYSFNEVINQKIDFIIQSDEIEIILPPENGKKQTVLSQEAVITHKDGKKIHIGFSQTPWRNDENSKLGTIITFRDISTTKQMQIDMIRMDRLASLGVLAAGIAHEIRNPLAGIKTIVQTLEEEVEPNHPHREYLQRILRQVNRLDELLKTFFSYARPRPPIKKNNRVKDIVNEVMVLLGKKLKSASIEFSENYEKDLRSAYIDLNQILQVFLNLIINAVDAMPNGGSLSISAKNTKITPTHMDRRGKAYKGPRKELAFVEVKISDSGIGIRKEHQENIFDPFFTTKSQGTGLGLSIVYRIIEEHGGEIHVQSEIEKGTSFTILLPTEG